MKRLLIYGPIFWIVVLALAVTAFNLGLFHGQIERYLAAKSGANVQLGATTLIPKWPITIDVGATTFEHELFSFAWKAYSLEIGSLIPPYKLRVVLVEPKFVLKTDVEFKGVANDAGGGVGNGGSNDPSRLNFSLSVQGGEVSTPDIHLTKINLEFSQKQLLKSAARVDFRSMVQPKALPIAVPIALASEALTLSREAIKGEHIRVSLGGLAADASGTSLLQDGRHRWVANISAPDLSKLPEPPLDLPASDWRGAVTLKVEALKDGAAKPWSAEGDLRLEKVSANLKYKRDLLSVTGPGSADLSTHFRYNNGVPEIENLNAEADLTAASVVYQDLLQKSPAVPLKLIVAAHGNAQTLKLENLALEFWKLNARVAGEVGLMRPYASSFSFDVPAFSVDGAEKVILALAQSPAGGQAAVSGTWRGELTDPAQGHLTVPTFRFKDFAADISYDKQGIFKIKGPLKGSVEGRLEADQKRIIQAAGKGRLDASEAALVAGLLRKEAKRQMLADFDARSSGNAIELAGLTLDSFLGKLRLSGKVLEPFDPKLQMKVELTSLNLTELRMSLPEYRDKIPKGSVSAQVNLNGRYDKALPWNAWPLTIEGALRATLPEYTIAPEPALAPAKSAGAGKQAVESEAFLPKGFLIEHLKMKLNADVENFKKDKLTANGVHIDGTVGGARFQGSAAVREIFGGSVEAKGLEVPLVDPRPVLSGSLKWREVIIEDALGFAKPDYRDFAKGRLAGQSEFMTYLPADAEFLSFLKVKGDISAQPVTLNSVKIGEMINNLVKQAPMLKLQPVKMDPLHGLLRANFNLQKQVAEIEPLYARDVDNSELQLHGKVTIPQMQGDFAGTFLWAKPQVQGCLLEGNSDATGRMIIPVAVKGDLMHPGLDSLSDMVSKLGSKALECEGKKLVEKIKKDGGKQLETEVKKQLQNLFGH